MKMEEATRVAKLICDLCLFREKTNRPVSKGFYLDCQCGSITNYSKETFTQLEGLKEKYGEMIRTLIETEVQGIERKIVAELKALGVTVED